MCRFVAYLGAPILVEEIITKPHNSLIHQSYSAQESEMTVNGDGFGMGWYNKAIREQPALYRSVSPAWRDQNLLYNASFIKTPCFLAHIRAASTGAVSIENTHPFHYENFLMMHNGGILEFEKIKRDMIEFLDEESFEWIKGQSDTQYIMAMIMTYARKIKKEGRLTTKQLISCFKNTFSTIETLKKKHNIEAPSLYNIVITDGNRLIATRYSTEPEKEMRTLHYTDKMSCHICEKGLLHIDEPSEKRTATLIASEILSEEKERWKEVPQNHAVYIDQDLNVSLFDLN